jgi:hypothetical protein
VMNPRGELFGGFTTTYLDFFALHVFHTSLAPDAPPRACASTTSPPSPAPASRCTARC